MKLRVFTNLEEIFRTWAWFQLAWSIPNGNNEICGYKTYCVISFTPEGEHSESERPSQG